MIKHRLPPALPALLSSAAAAILLVACGGGGDPPAGGGGGALTFSAATPAAHNSTADPGTALSKGNDARPADGFSAVPYCDVYYEDFTASNGKHYALQVYFRQGDKQPLNASLMEAAPGAPPSWVVFHNDSGNPIGGVSVDTTARTITFSSKALSGSGGAVVTVSGTVGFQANATVPACGG